MTHWPLLLHSMGTPDTDPVGCLRTAAGLGLDGIELIVDDSYPCAVRPDAGPAALAALRRTAEDMGLRIAALAPYAKDFGAEAAADRARAAAALDRAVELADALGAGGVRVLPGREVPAGDHAAALDRAAATLRPVAERALRAAVSLNLENHMDTLATTARHTRSLADLVGSAGLGILYDQANLTLMGAEEPVDAVDVQWPLIRHVHVKNFIPTPLDRRPVGLGAGVVDWRTTVRALAAAGYRGAVTFEYERRWYPDALPPPPEGLPADRDLLRCLMDEEIPPCA
ncbi:sugar phosphate isomerase/epimerase family protein [Micromonospora echinospora]|uniref:sugar phosphate isomerase/epimerase family protein n=1 Tax=Micromonospora echinospora TaxID=1877 RepID=UPI003795E3F4